MDAIHTDPRIEKAMIGCIAASPDLLDEFPVTPEHFAGPGPHELISVMIGLHRKGRQISLHSVLGAMKPAQISAIGDHNIHDLLSFVSKGAAPTLYEGLCRLLVARRSQAAVEWASSRLRSGLNAHEDAVDFAYEFTQKTAAISTDGDAENLLGAITREIDRKIERMEKGEHQPGRATFSKAWNKAFGGIGQGSYLAIAGRPGCGKTALMEQFISDHTEAGEPVVVFEKDMAPQKLIERIACRNANVPHRSFQRGTCAAEALQCVKSWVHKLRREALIRIYAPQTLTPERMCAISRREIRSGAKCVFLDHITGLHVGRDWVEGLTRASLTIRNNVTETNTAHVVIAHLNREGGKGKGRPSPDNIKGFDQLYGDVDGMAMLWSDEEPDESDPNRKIHLYAAKNREGGESQDTLTFNGPMIKFLP